MGAYRSSFGALVVVMLTLVVSLSLTLAALLTDFWLLVETEGVVLKEKENNYHQGFWRRCYDDVPSGIPADDLVGSDSDCILIYEDLIKDSSVNVTSDEELVDHLSRSYIGLSITSAAAQLATIITLICGSWPGDCKRIKKPSLYFCSTFVLLIATMAGIACGVCYIATREVEEKDLDMYKEAEFSYGWSFMLHWIATGICLVDGFIILCMVKFSYDELNNKSQHYFNM